MPDHCLIVIINEAVTVHILVFQISGFKGTGCIISSDCIFNLPYLISVMQIGSNPVILGFGVIIIWSSTINSYQQGHNITYLANDAIYNIVIIANIKE